LQPTGDWLNQPGGLAERLRHLRKVAGLTGDQLASQLRWPRSKIPKLENGRQMPSESDILAWITACGHPDAAPALLESLSEAQAIHRQWRHKLRSGHAALQDEFDALFCGASRIRNFEILLMPGLLQTPDYARYRILEAVRLHATAEDQAEAAVAARMRRQTVLSDPAKPFEFVTTESALRYLLCPPGVLLGQLYRLLIASGLDNVTLGIIPPGKELTIAPMAGFLIADDTTILETFTSMDTYHGAESAAYHRYADELLAQSLTGQDARELITSAAADLRTLPRLPSSPPRSLTTRSACTGLVT
jgi:transcriptional regulator with XRE-family HTH domain